MNKTENSKHSQQDCNGGQTISDNVGSSRNPLQGKVLATSENRAYGLQATSERSDYKSASNLETTGDVRLKSSQVVSLMKDGTPRSSKTPADNIQTENSKIEIGCGKKDGFGRKCGNIFETWKDGVTKETMQEIRYYCPSCRDKQKLKQETGK